MIRPFVCLWLRLKLRWFRARLELLLEDEDRLIEQHRRMSCKHPHYPKLVEQRRMIWCEIQTTRVRIRELRKQLLRLS